MTVWTAEQTSAIALRHRRLLVSAAAGSGKTAVLTERIVQRISDPAEAVDIDELLIMTFTRAAAAEMRERIRKKLSERLSGGEAEVSPGVKQRLKKQVALLELAQITTIDSFCLSVIREHADLTELDPAFRVGGEEELSLLRADVMEELLEERYAKGEAEFLRFAEGFSQGKSDAGIGEYVLSVYRFSESAAWPEEWLASCVREAEESAASREAAAGTAWARDLVTELKRYAAALLERAEEALKLCREEDGPSGYGPAIQGEQQRLLKLSAAENLTELQSALAAFASFERLGRNPKGTDPEKAARAKELREFWKGELKKLYESFAEQEEIQSAEDRKAEAETVRVICELTEDFRARYRAKKRARNLLDFSDLEHLALSLLWEKAEDGSRRPSALAREYAEHFREIYVDEYQDSNGVQEALLQAIEHGELFLVGDVKQSVYGFRQARPELFMEKYGHYRKYDPSEPDSAMPPEGCDTRVDLRKNFRSRAELLNSVNAVFQKLMDTPVGGIRYDADAALYPGADFPEGSKGGAYESELLLTELTDDAEETREEAEARLIAGRIRELMDAETGLRVTEDGILRPLQYSDIAILLRSARGSSERYVNVLMGEGIPAEAEQHTGYFSAPEVKTVLSLLSAIDNPFQDIPLAAVLHSPLCGLSETELALLSAEGETRLLAQGKEKSALWERLAAVRGAGRFPEAEQKLEHILQFLDGAAQRASYLSLPALLRELLSESGYLSYAAALPGGEVRKANLDMLVTKAGEFERTGYRGLYDFVRYIELLKKYNTDYGEAQTGESRGDAVRIMTIHKSKGLEFPLVFLAGTGKRFNLRDSSAGIIVDQDFGIAADCVDLKLRTKGSTLKKRALAWHMRTQFLGEELRVLYVAMTRAKEKLIVTATVQNAEKRLSELETASDFRPDSADVRAAGCCLDWLLLAMRGDPARCCFRVTLRAQEALAAEMEQSGAEAEALEQRLRALIVLPASEEGREQLAALRFSYPHEADTTLYGKRSVSELKYLGQDEDDADAWRPDFTAQKETEAESAESGAERVQRGSLRGAQRGTAYHRVMEHFDYSLLTGDGGAPSETQIRAALSELIDSELFTEEERAALKTEDFVCFFCSELGQRMAHAMQRGVLRREAQFVMAVAASELDPGTASEEPVLVQGVIDAWFEEEGELVVVDYKTDHIAAEEELKRRYRVQLGLYARALQMMEGKKPSELLLWSFALGRAIRL